MAKAKISNSILILIVVIASCSNTHTAPAVSAPDDAKKTDTVITRDISSLVKNASTSQYNNFARFIAGLNQLNENSYTKTQKDSVWIRHSLKLNAKWNLMTRLRTAKLNTWAATELPAPMRESEVLFYPFSGADILNANLLFPKAKSYYMFGLEPVGNLPDVLLNTSRRDSLQHYFNALNVSLNSLTNFSFFRTKSMAVDFNADELNGTIHLMLLFLSRNNNTIADIRYVYIDDNGLQKENNEKKIKHNDGVEITYIDTLKMVHTVTYYSVNLDNAHLDKNKGLQDYIKNLGSFNTYLKAASYLMHNASFSKIRADILDQTKYLLQDDSGIPYRFFNDKNKWKASLFGMYVPPIPLFANYNQADLNQAYKDSTIIHKPLNFGIGYNFNQSNLMLFEKNNFSAPGF